MSSAFKFRFEKLVEYVERKTEEAEAEFRKETEIRDRIIDDINAIKARIVSLQREIRELKDHPKTIRDLLLLNRKLDYEASLLREQKQRLAIQEERVAEARSRLIERQKELEMFEKMRAKKKEEHRIRVLKSEQKRLDEMALLRG